MTRNTTSREFFEEMYRGDADPWDFASDQYELERYRRIVTVLHEAAQGKRYPYAFEPGCSIGVLTEMLGAICDRIDAMDISPTAVKQAQERCARLPGIKVMCGSVTEGIPGEAFDLIVLSEIGYYLEEEVLSGLAREVVDRLPARGVLLAVHWLGVSPDHRLSGDRVHELLGMTDGLRIQRTERHAGYRLELWTKNERSTNERSTMDDVCCGSSA